MVSAGEILYYPAYFFHQTRCLDELVIGVTGLMVGTEEKRDDLRRLPHEEFYLDIKQKCSRCWDKQSSERTCHDGENGWFGDAIDRTICESYLDRCARLWHEHATGKKDGSAATMGEAAKQKVADLTAQHGASHADTLAARGVYANVLFELGERLAAKDEFIAVVEAKKTMLGKHHMSTLESQHNMALLLGRLVLAK